VSVMICPYYTAGVVKRNLAETAANSPSQGKHCLQLVIGSNPVQQRQREIRVHYGAARPAQGGSSCGGIRPIAVSAFAAAHRQRRP
jgi:hypothetical protein